LSLKFYACGEIENEAELTWKNLTLKNAPSFGNTNMN
jgi:hypothetical protein